MNFPVIMVKGNAWTPQRFWYYETAENQEQKDELEEQGFVESTYNKEK